jgi:hypothetical protein
MYAILAGRLAKIGIPDSNTRTYCASTCRASRHIYDEMHRRALTGWVHSLAPEICRAFSAIETYPALRAIVFTHANASRLPCSYRARWTGHDLVVPGSVNMHMVIESRGTLEHSQLHDLPSASIDRLIIEPPVVHLVKKSM